MKKDPTFRRSRIKTLFGHIFQFRFWLDVGRVHAFLLYMQAEIKKFFTVAPIKDNTDYSFELALAKYSLTEATLHQKERALLWWSRLLTLVTLGLLGLMVLNGLHGSWKACGMSAVLAGISVTLAFRYHFLSYHIRSRRLGCSIQEWVQYGLLGRKPT